MPKKPPCNAFYFFMLEKKQEYAKHGIKYTMRQLPTVVSPLWNQLTVEEKAKYERIAKEQKAAGAAAVPFENKLASDGTSIKDNFLKETEGEQQRRKEILEIRSFIHADTLEPDIFKENAAQIKFYVMAFNILCKTNNDETPEKDEYIPIEIGLCEYSIERGIIKSYHKHIDYGSIPVGYQGKAKAQSEEYHKLLYAPQITKEKNYKLIWREIISFVGARETGSWPPIFILCEQIVQTRGCLKWLAEEAGVRNPNIQVLNLSQLLYEICDGIEADAHLSIYVCSDLLNRTCFDYTIGINCDYHEEIDSRYCALGLTKRLCYLFSDVVCKRFDIELTNNHIPNRHTASRDYTVYLPHNVQPEVSVPRTVRVGDNVEESPRKSKFDSLDDFEDEDDCPPRQPQYCHQGAIGRGIPPKPPLSPREQQKQLNAEFAKFGIGRGYFPPK